MAILAVYLHILAARSGLVALYVFAAGWGFYTGMKRSKLLGVGIVAAILLVAVLGIIYVPTLKARFGYLSYTYIIYSEGQRNGNYSDMGRAISYSIAGRIISHRALTGVGAGDMLTEMKQVYQTSYPDVAEAQQLLPHNQFLVVWLGCGIVALVLYVIWWLAPVWRIKLDRDGFYVFMVWLILFLPLIIEPMLEVQFGVFVYVFFLLWQMHAKQHRSVQTGANENLITD
jgi:O-antigen ligase